MDVEIKFGFAGVKFVHKTSSSYQKGSNLKNAGHVLNLVERSGCITAEVIRQTSINLPPYNVKIEFDAGRNVTAASCSCIAGISGHCKHISATVIAVNEEDATTATSGPCTWKVPSARKMAKEKYSKGQKWVDIFGVRKIQKVHAPIKVTKEMVTFQIPSMLEYMISATVPSQDATIITSQEELNVRPRILSNVEIVPPACNIEDNIRKVFLNQKSATVLQELYQRDIMLTSQCCFKTYNDRLPCNAVRVCLETLTNKKQWMIERKYRITASRAYSLYTYNGKDWTEKSKKYFHSKSFTNKYVQHGITWESAARLQYSNDKKCQILEMGLVVCQTDPWLAVSPDGVIFQDNEPTKLLEIKCPYKGISVSAENIEQYCVFLKRENGKLTLKRKHTYYSQVQINMAVLNLKECDFVVFCSVDKSYKVVNVPFDEGFAKEELFKLKNIYFQNMLHLLCN